MKKEDNHRELFYGAMALGEDPDALAKMVQDHVRKAPSTEAAMSDLMLATARLAHTLRKMADAFERDHPGWSFIENVQQNALREEMDGG